MRRYDIDALRVLAFGVLILYHVGMYYVADWDWHIKSPAPSTGLQFLMYLTNPWRMSLLFLVSGMAMAFACRGIGAGTVLRLRNRRLLIPLAFSMAVIVPPQVYVELVAKEGMSLGYVQFLGEYLDPSTSAYPAHQHGPLGLWTWNHLWFLPYLWVYTALFVLVKPALDRVATVIQGRRGLLVLILLLPALVLTGYRALLADAWPPSNALFDDWFNHARYLSMFFGGYVVARWDGFWSTLVARRWWLLLGAITTYATLMLLIASGSYQLALAEGTWVPLLRLAASLNQWLWILAVLGLGACYLNRPSRLLAYMNEAILPWYMLHQTLIVLFAFWLAPLALWQPIEAVLLISGTVAGCAIGYEMVRRFQIGRLLFGLRASPAASSGTAGAPRLQQEQVVQPQMPRKEA